MYKIKNISNDKRKFRIHKSAEGFMIRPGEELIIPHLPIVERPDIFKIIDLDKEKKEMSEKKTKKQKEVKINDE